MGAISSTIRVNDGMSKVLQSMNRALNIVLDSYERLQDISSNSIDVANIEEARNELSNVAAITRDLEEEMDRAGDSTERMIGSAGGLNSSLAKVVKTAAGLFAITRVKGFIDDCTDSFDTQLNSANQLRTTLANMVGSDYDKAYENISQKASSIQASGMYGDEAMLAGAAEFATYFTDTDAIEVMMDTLADYAAGMSGGSVLDASAMVDYATGLGKIVNGSYDAMTKKGFQFSEIQKAIIEGTATQADIVAELGEEYANASQDMLSAQVISQVIGESWEGMYESMSNSPRGEIESLNNTIGDIKETVAANLYPSIISITNSVERHMPQISNLLIGAGNLLVNILDFALQIASVIENNWSIIGPIIMGIVLALGAYAAISTVAAIASSISAAAKMLESGATVAATAAQYGLNAALLACPITWIVLLVMALIVALVALCNWIAETTGAAESGIGIITGSLYVAAAFIWNLIVAVVNMVIDIFVVLWNFIASFANFFGNVFNDPIGSIARLFFDLVDCVLGLLETCARAIDAIFGSSLADSVSGWRSDLSSWVDDTFGKGEEFVAKIDGSEYYLDRMDYGEAWDNGTAMGDGIASALDDFSLSNLFGSSGDLLSTDDYLTGINGNLGDISEDTSNISDSLEVTEEDLKYLRDIAEQEAINRFTTAEIKIEMQNNNTINSDMDIDGIVTKLEDKLYESMEIAAEGVY